MAKIGDAPNGENTSLDGTEKVPLSGSKFSLISTVKSYLDSFFAHLTGNENIAGNKTFTGYSSFIPSVDSDGTIAVFTETHNNDYGFYAAQYSSDSGDFDKSSLLLYRVRNFDGNFTGPMVYGVQYNGSSDSSSIQGDFLKFENDDGIALSVDKNGVVNIQSGSTYNINGSPHTHLSSSVNDSDVIFTDNTVNNSSSDTHGYLPKLSGSSDVWLDGTGNWTTPTGGLSSVYDSDIILQAITTNNADSDHHGFLPTLDGSSSKFLNGSGTWSIPSFSVADSDVTFTDNTTGNSSSSAHGYLAKLSNDSNTWLNGKQEWTAPSATSAWTQVIDESGASYANFTTGTGTWSSDGTVIKQTDASASERKSKYNTAVVNSILIYEAEIQLRTAGANARGGLIVSNGTAGLNVYINDGSDVVSVDTEGVSARVTFASTIVINTWYKLRLVNAGGACTVYLDGTLLGTAINIIGTGTTTYNISNLYLYTYTAEVWFRNIKAWNLTLPA